MAQVVLALGGATLGFVIFESLAFPADEMCRLLAEILHRQPLESVDEEQSFLNSLAALVASVADKHWR